MSKIKLKKCPFCGKHPETFDSWLYGYFTIYCTCPAKPLIKKQYEYRVNAKEEAARIWNMRDGDKD